LGGHEELALLQQLQKPKRVEECGVCVQKSLGQKRVLYVTGIVYESDPGASRAQSMSKKWPTFDWKILDYQRLGSHSKLPVLIALVPPFVTKYLS
jgi:hypothetical protein